MTVELEWRFEGEVFDKPPQEERPPRRPRWRLWAGLIAVALVLAGVALYCWWRGRRQALATLENEVQAAAQLELRALAEGDTELYLSLQDDADPAWHQAQRTRAALDALLPPPLPGLTATAVLSVENARVVGDVARVEFVRAAAPAGGEAAPFRAIRFYRRGDDGRWLHTRADLDFAGYPVIFTGKYVQVTVFAADAGWMETAVPRLEGLADQFCGLVSCQGHPRLALVFTDTLDTAAGQEVNLPAPLFVGAPDDEAARAVWEADLRELLLDRLIAREAGQPDSRAPGGPRGGAFFRASLRRWLRAQLGLSAPIAPDLDLIGEALDAGGWIPLGSLWEAWPADDAPWRPLAEAEIDLLLAFAEQEYGAPTVAALLHALPDAHSTVTLIEEALDEDWPAFERQYAAYVHRVTGRPTELPDEVSACAEYDLVAACGEPARLWGLRLDRAEMTALSPAVGFGSLAWSPNGTRLLAWRGGVLTGLLYLVEADGSGVRQLGSVPAEARPVGWSPDGSYVAYRTFSRAPGGGLVDVETGETVALGGSFFSTWSPDGARLVYLALSDAGVGVWLGAGDGSHSRRVGEGFAAAWSPDGMRIAFASTQPDPGPKIYDVATGETTTLLETSTLYDLLGPEAGLAPVYADTLAWSPTGEWIGLGINQHDERGAVKGCIALVRPDGSDPHVLLPREAWVVATGWSADGRWLTAITYGAHGRVPLTATVIGVDGSVLLEASGTVSWSPGGQYLAVGERDRLRILEVASGTWHAFQPAARCGIVAWNPRGPLHEP